MVSIREMTAANERTVMGMVGRFYHSPVVEHEVDPAILRRSFQTAVDPAEPLIQGLVLEKGGHPVDYHYMCIGCSAEVGGRYLLLDELYLAPEYRDKGHGEQVIRWAMEQHPECIHYRLEVTGKNRATRLYEQMGFRYLDYKQVAIDRQKGVFGMARMEEAKILRTRTDVHYNCCQSVSVPFADLCNLDKETAFKLGASFGSSMRHGFTRGAVTGALMVLRLVDKEANGATALTHQSREKNQVLDCANLLRLTKERGEGRRYHYDRMVYETVELLKSLLK